MNLVPFILIGLIAGALAGRVVSGHGYGVLGDRPALADPTGCPEARLASFAWACVASIVATMIVGFTWGGWVTGGPARKVVGGISEDAVVRRLATMCAVRFWQDAKKGQKLKGLKETGSYERADYVKKQGWATRPGEPKPDAKVADECVKLLISMS